MGRVAPVLLVCLLFGGALGLELRGTEEGSCRNLGNMPYHRDVDPVWLDTLPYINAGSKYHMYRQASVHPHFRQMREFEFYYDACFVKNTSLAEGNGSLFGFGRLLGSFDVRLAGGNDPAALVDAIPNNPSTGTPQDFFRQRVTLTDYRTFAVMVHCWMGADQRTWDVYSLLPQLDEATERLIEDHVQNLGFDREKFIFLRYDNCEDLSVPRNTPGNQTPPRKTGSGARGSPPSSGSIKRGVPSGGANTLKRSSTSPAPPKITPEPILTKRPVFGGRTFAPPSTKTPFRKPATPTGSTLPSSGSIKRGVPSGGANTLRRLSTSAPPPKITPEPIITKEPVFGDRKNGPASDKIPGSYGWTP